MLFSKFITRLHFSQPLPNDVVENEKYRLNSKAQNLDGGNDDMVKGRRSFVDWGVMIEK